MAVVIIVRERKHVFSDVSGVVALSQHSLLSMVLILLNEPWFHKIYPDQVLIKSYIPEIGSFIEDPAKIS